MEVILSGMIAVGLAGLMVWLGLKGSDIQHTVRSGHRAKEEAYLDENFKVKPGMEKQYDRVVKQNQEEFKSVDNTLVLIFLGAFVVIGILLSLSGYGS